MLICWRHECHTTAGCAHRDPAGRLCVFPTSPTQSYAEINGWLHQVGALADFTDDEIAREYHWRMVQKLGDPRKCVSSVDADNTRETK